MQKFFYKDTGEIREYIKTHERGNYGIRFIESS